MPQTAAEEHFQLSVEIRCS